jgi:hypothetical protein
MAESKYNAKKIISILRDITLLFGGLAIALHEAVFTMGERPSILILAATMMGLPIFLRKDSSGNGE